MKKCILCQRLEVKPLDSFKKVANKDGAEGYICIPCVDKGRIELNELTIVDDAKLYECAFCETKIDWEGSHTERGHIWECEECGAFVCSKCITDSGGSVDENTEEILCPGCKGSK